MTDEARRDKDSATLPAPRPERASSIGEHLDGLIAAIGAGYRKTAIHAISKLVGGAARVANAWLDAKESEIRSLQEAKDAVRRELIRGVNKTIKADPGIVERAAEHFVDEIIGKQNNREGVARKTLEHLSRDSPPAESVERPAVDDDWLNRFSRYAEDASSDDLRDVFGKILAGQIRQPGKYSLFTLDFLSKMGKREAEQIAKLSPFVFSGIMPITKITKQVFDYERSTFLSSKGILDNGSVGMMTATFTIPLSDPNPIPPGSGRAGFAGDQRRPLLFTSSAATEVKINCSTVTDLGRELLALHESELDRGMLRELAADLRQQQVVLYVGRQGDAPDLYIYETIQPAD